MDNKGKDEEFGTGPPPVGVKARPNNRPGKEDTYKRKGKRETQEKQQSQGSRKNQSQQNFGQRSSQKGGKSFSKNRNQKGNAAITNSFKDGNMKLQGTIDALYEKIAEANEKRPPRSNNNDGKPQAPEPKKKPTYADLPPSQLTGSRLVDGFKVINKNPLWLGCDYALVALIIVALVSCTWLNFINFSFKVPVSYEKVCEETDFGWNFSNCYRGSLFQSEEMIGEQGRYIYESTINKYVKEDLSGIDEAMSEVYREWNLWWSEGLSRYRNSQSQLDNYFWAWQWSSELPEIDLFFPPSWRESIHLNILLPVPNWRHWYGLIGLSKLSVVFYSGFFDRFYAPLAMNSLSMHKGWFVPGNCFFWDRLGTTTEEICHVAPIHFRYYIKWYHCFPIILLYPIVQIIVLIIAKAQTTEEEIVFKEYVSHNITKDQRPDPIAAADLKYKEPTYARMVHKYYYTWGFKIFDGVFAKKFICSRRLIRTEEYVVSVELFTHIAIAKYGNNLDAANVVRASIDNAAKVFSTVNLSRFMSLEDEFTKAIVQRTSNLAYHYYLEYVLTDNVLFQSAPPRVRAFSMDIGLVRSSSQSLGLSNKMLSLVTLVLLTCIVVHLYKLLPLASLQVPLYPIQTLMTLRQ